MKKEKQHPCTARLITSPEPYIVIREPKNHNHEPSLTLIQTESDVEIVQSTTGRRRVIPRVRERVRREQKRVKYARDYSSVNMLVFT